MQRRLFLLCSAALAAGAAIPAWAADKDFAGSPFRKISDADWRKRLPPASYQVLRHEATERPGTSPLDQEHRKGTFICMGCSLPLFRSEWKFNSGTGWPSFFTAIDKNIGKKQDTSAGMVRTEYHCAQCGGHQGHLFNDGPRPTGLRYCNNGVALKFLPT